MKLVDFLNRPEKWTKGTYARTIGGMPVSSSSPYATCWCLIGAASKCFNIENKSPFYSEDWHYDKLLRAIQKHYPYISSVALFNDLSATTFDDIRKVLIEADI